MIHFTFETIRELIILCEGDLKQSFVRCTALCSFMHLLKIANCLDGVLWITADNILKVRMARESKLY